MGWARLYISAHTVESADTKSQASIETVCKWVNLVRNILTFFCCHKARAAFKFCDQLRLLIFLFFFCISFTFSQGKKLLDTDYIDYISKSPPKSWARGIILLVYQFKNKPIKESYNDMWMWIICESDCAMENFGRRFEHPGAKFTGWSFKESFCVSQNAQKCGGMKFFEVEVHVVTSFYTLVPVKCK